jgi:hypothetical protein
MQTEDLPGVITYTAAISACAKDVQWQQAIGALSMQTADLKPVVFTYTATTSACAQNGQWLQALGLLAMQTSDLLPVVITYAAAISACAMDAQRPLLLGLLARQKADLMPVGITYTVAISARAKDEKWQQAIGLLAMQSADLMPSRHHLHCCQPHKHLNLRAERYKDELVPQVPAEGCAVVTGTWPFLTEMQESSQAWKLRKSLQRSNKEACSQTLSYKVPLSVPIQRVTKPRRLWKLSHGCPM